MTFIFKSLGIKCVPYIAQVMPSFLNVIRTADVSFKEFLFQQLAVLIAIVKQHIRNYLDDIFVLIRVRDCFPFFPAYKLQIKLYNIIKQGLCEKSN